MREFQAETYEQQKGDFNNTDEALLLTLLRERAQSGPIIDIGCGDGKLTQKVHEVFPDRHLTALDNSQSQIQLAKNNVDEKIELLCKDIQEFVTDKSYAIAYSFYAFPHIPKSELRTALAAVRSLLAPGATFYLFTNICLFDTTKVPVEDQEACDVVFLDNWQSQINLVSLEEMRHLFAETGFKELENRELQTDAQVKDYGRMISWLFVLQ